MKKLILAGFLVLAGLPFAARAQVAQVPFNTITPANPNVMFFIDDAAFMSAQAGLPGGDNRSRFELAVNVIAGRHIALFYSRRFSPYSNAPLYMPHYDFKSKGERWVIWGSTVENYVMPRVIRLTPTSGDAFVPDAGGNLFIFVHASDSAREAALAGTGQVSNLAAFMRSLMPAGAAITPSLRWPESYVRERFTNATINFSSTDVVTNRIVYDGSTIASGTYYSFYDAMKLFYNYASTGTTSGSALADPYVIPLKWVAPQAAASYTEMGLPRTGKCYYTRHGSQKIWHGCWVPAAAGADTPYFLYWDGLNGTQKDALDGNVDPVSGQSKPDYRVRISVWKAAIAATNPFAGASTTKMYCYHSEAADVWGDAPLTTWHYVSDIWPDTDEFPTSMAASQTGIWGATDALGLACTSSSSGVFNLGAVAPTDQEVRDALSNRIPWGEVVTHADVTNGGSVDEFVISPLRGDPAERLDLMLKDAVSSAGSINRFHDWWCEKLKKWIPNYCGTSGIDCPPTVSWPSESDVSDPWYGGFYDHLYWDGAYKGSPGIMETFQNVNYGFATFAPVSDTSSNCGTKDTGPDSDGNCNSPDILFNMTTWGSFPRYSTDYPVTTLNASMREYVVNFNNYDKATNAPIISVLHGLWRYFYDTDFDANGHSTDLKYVEEQRLDPENPTQFKESMFFDLSFPTTNMREGVVYGDSATVMPENQHIIQCDPFYVHGCRRNYLIFVTGSNDGGGELEFNPANFPEALNTNITTRVYTDGAFVNQCSSCNLLTRYGSWDHNMMKTLGGEYKWIKALKDPNFEPDGMTHDDLAGCERADYGSGVDDMKKLGVMSLFVGYYWDRMNTSQQTQIAFMAWATTMDPNDEEEINYALVASDEDSLREQLIIVMNSIMAGQFTRSAPEIYETTGSIVTSRFDVGSASSNLWKGHLFAWDLDNVTAGTTLEPLYDAGEIIHSNQQSTRSVLTYLGDGSTLTRYNFTASGVSSGDTAIIEAFNPEVTTATPPVNLYWSNTVEVAQGSSLIAFLRGEATATFTSGKPLTWEFGPVFHSKPQVVGPPASITYGALPEYGVYATEHADRPATIWVGTGYGLLEAIALGDTIGRNAGLVPGEEIFGIMPPGVLQWAANLRKGVQIYGADGTPVVRDAIFYGLDGSTSRDWRTVLMTGLAGGGTSYFAIDITDVTNSADDVVPLWNYSDDNLAFTWSVPAVAPVSWLDPQDQISLRWAAFFGGGLQKDQDHLDTQKGNYFYVMDLQTGVPLRKWRIPDAAQITSLSPFVASATGDTLLNHVQVSSTPLIVDVDQDRDMDYVYFGDQEGRVWKANVSDTYDGDTAWQFCPFFDTVDLNFSGTVGAAEQRTYQQRMPVFYTPDATITPEDQILIFFATGNAEMTRADDDTQVNRIFAVIDPETTNCDYGQQLPATINGDTVMWPLTLEVGEKMLTPIYISAGMAIFKTWVPATTIACSKGTTRLWALDYLTGQPIIAGQPFVTVDAQGNPISIGGLTPYSGGLLDTTTEGAPVNTPSNVVAAEPLSWGEGMTFE